MKFDSEIYLEATTDELFRRIHRRGRKEESDISFEYLDTLNETYKKYAKKFSKWNFLLDKIFEWKNFLLGQNFRVENFSLLNFFPRNYFFELLRINIGVNH